MSFKISIQVDNNNNPQKTLASVVQHLKRAFIVNLDYKEPVIYKDVTYHYAIITPKAIGGRPQKISNEQKQEIRTRFQNVKTETSLINEFNVSHSLISNICRG